MNAQSEPEDTLAKYIEDHLSGWDVTFGKMYIRKGQQRVSIKFRDSSSKDYLYINAERTSHLGKIITRIYRMRHP